MTRTYVKPTIEMVEMLAEENLADSSYWEGSWHNNGGWWGSPNCKQ